MALFSELGLSQEFVDRLAADGITQPTPIQAEVFPLVMEGKSVLGFSKTGTGKTLAFLAPLVQRIFGPEAPTSKGIRLLVMVPTRELAFQVAEEFERLVGTTRRAVVVVGGEAEDRQIAGAKDADTLVATPGRLIDLLERRMLDVQALEAIVLDEADRLLDMGFLPDIRRLMAYLPPKRQMLFFSATLHFGVDELSYEFGAECTRIGEPAEDITVEGLDHRVSFVGDEEKLHALAHFLKSQGEKRGIVFSNYRDKAHYISERLERLGAQAACLTAQLNQAQRKRILDDFRNGRVQVLLASDLAARGLDVEHVDFVVNVDLPEDPPTYVHRVGRTARAGRQGRALSFVGFEDAFRLEKIESFLGKAIDREAFDPALLSGPLPRFGNAPVKERPAHSANDRSSSSRGQGAAGAPHRKGPPSNAHRGGNLSPQSGPRKPQNVPHTAPKAPASSGTKKPTPAPKAPTTLWSKLTAWVGGIFGAKKTAPARPSASSNLPPPKGQEKSASASRPASGPGRGRGRRGGRRSGRPSSPAGSSSR